MTTRARERLPELGNVPTSERATLRNGFGAALRAERGYRSVDDLASAAGMNPVTIRRLESGIRRPTTSSVWRLARALRPRGTLRDRVAVDERLRDAAGGSLVHANTRPHRAREAMREHLRAEARAAEGPVVADGDTFGAVLVAELGRVAARSEGPAGTRVR